MKPRRLFVYVHPNADGLAFYAVAAYTQREAVKKMEGPRGRLGTFKRDGGRRAHPDDLVYAPALAAPDTVFRRPHEYVAPPHTGWQAHEPAYTEKE